MAVSGKESNLMMPDQMINREAISQLEDELTDVVMEWRITKAHTLIEEYHRVYQQMLDCGWDGVLDIDIMLPSTLMPAYHTERMAQLKLKHGM